MIDAERNITITTKIVQELVLVFGDNFTDVNGYLRSGWRIANISASRTGAGYSCCYVLLEKEVSL